MNIHISISRTYFCTSEAQSNMLTSWIFYELSVQGGEKSNCPFLLFDVESLTNREKEREQRERENTKIRSFNWSEASSMRCRNSNTWCQITMSKSSKMNRNQYYSKTKVFIAADTIYLIQ